MGLVYLPFCVGGVVDLGTFSSVPVVNFPRSECLNANLWRLVGRDTDEGDIVGWLCRSMPCRPMQGRGIVMPFSLPSGRPAAAMPCRVLVSESKSFRHIAWGCYAVPPSL